MRRVPFSLFKEFSSHPSNVQNMHDEGVRSAEWRELTETTKIDGASTRIRIKQIQVAGWNKIN